MVSHLVDGKSKQSEKCGIRDSKYCKKDTINLNDEVQNRKQSGPRNTDRYYF